MKDRDIAVLIVHLSELNKSLMCFNKGILEEGLANVARVLKKATELQIPIIYSHYGPLIKELYENIPGYKHKEIRWFDHMNTHFKNEDTHIKRLILLGFHGSNCVEKAAKNAIEYGKTFCTAEDLLFGNKENNPNSLDDKTKAFYKEKGLYPTHHELIAKEFG